MSFSYNRNSMLTVTMAPSTRLFNFKPRRVRSRIFPRMSERARSHVPGREYFSELDVTDPQYIARPDPSLALASVRDQVYKYWVENYLRIRRLFTKLLTDMGYQRSRIGFRSLSNTLKLIQNARVGRGNAGAAAWNASYYYYRERVHAREANERIFVAQERFTTTAMSVNLIHEALHGFARFRRRVLGSTLDHRIMHALGEVKQPDHDCRVGFQRPSRQCPRPR